LHSLFDNKTTAFATPSMYQIYVAKASHAGID